MKETNYEPTVVGSKINSKGAKGKQSSDISSQEEKVVVKENPRKQESLRKENFYNQLFLVRPVASSENVKL